MHACPGYVRLYGDGDAFALHRFKVRLAVEEIRATFELEIGLPKWQEWAVALRALRAMQTGRATLRAAEAALELEAHADKRGRLQWTGIVRRPGLVPQATLEFSVRDDVASLAKTIEAIEYVGADMGAEPLPPSSLR